MMHACMPSDVIAYRSYLNTVSIIIMPSDVAHRSYLKIPLPPHNCRLIIDSAGMYSAYQDRHHPLYHHQLRMQHCVERNKESMLRRQESKLSKEIVIFASKIRGNNGRD